MTAEVAVFNRQAIALAADSFVTITAADEPKKTYSVNKLFALSKHRPVGFMTYGNGSPNGIPWEVLVKECRRRLASTSFGTIREYHEWFSTELTNLLSTVGRHEQGHALQHIAVSHFERLRRKIDKDNLEAIEANGSTDVMEVARSVIQSDCERLRSTQLLSSNCDGGFAMYKFHEAIQSTIEGIFGALPLSDDTVRNLFQIAGYLLDRRGNIHSDAGYVIAGFGEDEIFPSVAQASLRGVFDGRLFASEPVFSGHAYDDSEAAIIPFAQVDVMATFISGISPDLRREIFANYRNFGAQIAEVVFRSLKDESHDDDVLEAIYPAVDQVATMICDTIVEMQQTRHVEPLLDSLKFMPKEELASIAEALVNLTSVKRSLRNEIATVGGATDVAIITKGDGFVWIQRKHYFDPKLNHQFFGNYFEGKA